VKPLPESFVSAWGGGRKKGGRERKGRGGGEGEVGREGGRERRGEGGREGGREMI